MALRLTGRQKRKRTKEKRNSQHHSRPRPPSHTCFQFLLQLVLWSVTQCVCPVSHPDTKRPGAVACNGSPVSVISQGALCGLPIDGNSPLSLVSAGGRGLLYRCGETDASRAETRIDNIILRPLQTIDIAIGGRQPHNSHIKPCPASTHSQRRQSQAT